VIVLREDLDMKSLISNKSLRIALFLFLEIISIGMGMGVPIFTILFGFIVGLVIPMVIETSAALTSRYLAKIMRAAFITSAITFLGMAIIWLPTFTWLFDPARDLANFGIPMILYSPRASFIGWIVLMVLISPFLQFLMTLFGSILWIVIFAERRGMGTTLAGGRTAAYR
jgi:hypothetical protein